MTILCERPSCLLALSPVALTLVAPEPLLLLPIKELSSLVSLQSVRHCSTASFSEARAGPFHEEDREFGLAHYAVAVAVCAGHCHRHGCIAQRCGNDGEEDHGEVQCQKQRECATCRPPYEGVVEPPPPLLHRSPPHRGIYSPRPLTRL